MSANTSLNKSLAATPDCCATRFVLSSVSHLAALPVKFQVVEAISVTTLDQSSRSSIYCIADKTTLCLKKGPTFKLSVTLSNLTDFQNFCTTGKRIKFATKSIRNYPPHFRHVATLPWEIKNSNFLQTWKKMQKRAFLIATNFVILPQIVIFSVFKVASLSSY